MLIIMKNCDYDNNKKCLRARHRLLANASAARDLPLRGLRTKNSPTSPRNRGRNAARGSHADAPLGAVLANASAASASLLALIVYI